MVDSRWVSSRPVPLALETAGKGRKDVKIKVVQVAAASWASADHLVGLGIAAPEVCTGRGGSLRTQSMALFYLHILFEPHFPLWGLELLSPFYTQTMVLGREEN